MKELEKKYIFNTYNRQPESTPYFVKGKGIYLWDEKGEKYMDMLSGLGVNNLGHCHPAVSGAIKEQADILQHTSNLYYTKPQIELAQLLIRNSGFDKVFFANSGAEANEAAIKIARKYYYNANKKNKFEIITFTQSFHGRTMATLTATGQSKFHNGFSPLLPGFKYADFNNLQSVNEAINENTCAIMVEPIQGEGGVYPATKEFLQGLKELCYQKDLLLIFDEIQCGLGRTGELFAYQSYGVVPDIVTLAKALGGGLPIGAMMAGEKLAKTFQPGDHASTFGGNPVTCAAGVAVMNILLAETIENTAVVSKELFDKLVLLKESHSIIEDIRGKGLMIGIEFKDKGQEVFEKLLQKKVLCNLIAGKILRLLPPLIISKDEVEKLLAILDEVLNKVKE